MVFWVFTFRNFQKFEGNSAPNNRRKLHFCSVYFSALSGTNVCFLLTLAASRPKNQKSQSLPQDCLVCCLLVILWFFWFLFFCFFCFPVLHSSHLHVSANAWTCIVSIMSVLPLTPSGATVVCRQVAASCNVSRPVTLAQARWLCHGNSAIVEISLLKVLPTYPKLDGFVMDRVRGFKLSSKGAAACTQIKYWAVDKLTSESCRTTSWECYLENLSAMPYFTSSNTPFITILKNPPPLTRRSQYLIIVYP